MNRHRGWLELTVLAVVLALAGWLRGHELDRFIASDELRWTCRSVNFRTALADGAWAQTFQVGHPGVVTMWLGTLALPPSGQWSGLCQTTDGGRDLSRLDDVGMEGVLATITPRLFGARRGVAAGTLAILALLYLLLRRGVGLSAPLALAGLGMVALDPYLVAHSRVLHLDALVSLLALAAVVALAASTADWAPGWAVAGGVLAGLAMLNKVSAVLLLPFVLAWLVLAARRSGSWRAAGRWLLLWGLAAGVTYVMLWPAMWVDPGGTLRAVAHKALAEGMAPHPSGNYFLGRPVADPGPLFYPLVAAFRLTPWGLVAAVVAAYWLVPDRPPRNWLPGERLMGRGRLERRLVVLLVGWALFFGLAMTFGPKKFDRYLLPALVALNLAGGVALAGVATHLLTRRGVRAPGALLGPVLALLALQGGAALRAEPYPLAYYNPLVGGIRMARQVLLVGWGEGYDLAAGWLNAQPDASQLEVAVRGVSNFAPLFRGRTRSAPGYRPGRTDYVVLYINQVQRRRNHQLLATYYDRPEVQPDYVGRIAGVPFVWVYHNVTVAPLEEALDRLAAPGDVLVAGGETVFARHYDGPWPLVRYWGHWGEAEIRQALEEAFPLSWQRAWVVRYPGYDPDAVLAVLGEVARRGSTVSLAGGQVEITPFRRPR